MELLSDVFMWLGIIVTAATTIVGALDKIAQVTPTTKDDLYVGEAKRYLGIATAFLDKFSVWTHKK